MVALTRRVGQNHLHAAVGGVVCPLAFFAEHVADAVGIGFVKLRKTDGGEDDGGDDWEEDKAWLKTRRWRLSRQPVTERFSWMKYQAAGQRALLGRVSHLRSLDHNRCDMTAVVLLS